MEGRGGDEVGGKREEVGGSGKKWDGEWQEERNSSRTAGGGEGKIIAEKTAEDEHEHEHEHGA